MDQLFLTGTKQDDTLEAILQFLQVKAPQVRAARLSKSKRSFKNQFFAAKKYPISIFKVRLSIFLRPTASSFKQQVCAIFKSATSPKSWVPTHGRSRSRNAGPKVPRAGSRGLVTGDRCPRGPADREGFLVEVAPIPET